MHESDEDAALVKQIREHFGEARAEVADDVAFPDLTMFVAHVQLTSYALGQAHALVPKLADPELRMRMVDEFWSVDEEVGHVFQARLDAIVRERDALRVELERVREAASRSARGVLAATSRTSRLL